LNMDKIMKQAQKMQAQMAKVQEELAGEKVEGSAGGGMVTVTANGQGDVVGVRIDPEVMKGDDVEMLEDLVLAAVNEALRRSKELAAERMGRITGGLGSMGLFQARSLSLADSFERLTVLFRKLPGVGAKTARRMAFFVLQQPVSYAEELAACLSGLKDRIFTC